MLYLPTKPRPTSWSRFATSPGRSRCSGAIGRVEPLTLLRHVTAAYELIARAGLTHERPPYGIEAVGR